MGQVLTVILQPSREQWGEISRQMAGLLGYCEKTGATGVPQLLQFFDALEWAIDRTSDFEQQTNG